MVALTYDYGGVCLLRVFLGVCALLYDRCDISNSFIIIFCVLCVITLFYYVIWSGFTANMRRLCVCG